MATTSFVGGRLRVSHGAGYRATTARPRSVDLGAGTDVDDEIVALLRRSGFDDAHRVVVEPRRPRTRGAAAAPAPARGTAVSLALDVGPEDDAVVLLEHQGCYTWLRARHVASRDPQLAGRTAVFDFEVPPPAAAERALGGVPAGAARATVLPFASRAVAAAAIRLLESVVETGLVHLTDPDPRTWQRIPSLDAAGLDATRTNRVLLLVHGTFDSTVGAFGGLAVTDPGRSFLTRAIAEYDAVLGFDHRTLSVDPLENARQLADLLTPFRGRSVTLDVVCHSRGGLTTRGFVEEVLPGLGWRGQVDRIVFVAATNAGTHFADARRWGDLADLATNLVAAQSRAIAALPGGDAVAGLVVAGVRGIGALVRWLAAYATDPDSVPGIAAMVPDGPFVTTVNEDQPGQPRPGTPWFVVSSDFEVTVDDHPPELPAAVVARLVDGVVDEVFDGPNDLVVDVASMSAIDLSHGGGYVRDELALPVNSTVYHTNYVLQESVCGALVAWLLDRLDRLEAPATAAGDERAAPLPDLDLADGGTAGAGADDDAGGHAGWRGPLPEAVPPPAPEPDAASGVRATLAAELPAQPPVGVPVVLRVRLGRGAIAASDGAASATTVLPVQPDQPVDVQVVPTTNVVLEGPDLDRLLLPPGGGWSELPFSLRAVTPGPVRVRVLARQGRDLLGTLTLDAVAVAPADVTGGAQALTSGQVEVASLTSPALADVAWLEVAQTEVGGVTRFRYALRLPGSDERTTAVSPPIGDAAEFTAALVREVQQLWFDYSDTPATYLAKVQDRGAQLFEQLFPQDFQRVLWENRSRLDRLFLLADEPFVPWELVHLKPPVGPRQRQPRFLGQLGLVRWPFTPLPAQPTLRARDGRVFAICPDYADPALDLTEVHAEAAYLETTLAATPVSAREAAVRRLLRRRDGFDLLHFSGHGLADAGNIAEAKIVLAGRTVGGVLVTDYLSSTTVAENARLADGSGPGPLVVLNACQVGRSGEELSSLGGFARAFLEAGASAFVSCLWSVNQTPARIFVETFYDRLLAGDTVATAALAARTAARASGDATWLAYVVYARPDAVLVRS